jgi:hypothetical protein
LPGQVKVLAFAAVQLLMLPDVSTASMKYGRDGGGQSTGLFDEQS